MKRSWTQANNGPSSGQGPIAGTLLSHSPPRTTYQSDSHRNTTFGSGVHNIGESNQGLPGPYSSNLPSPPPVGAMPRSGGTGSPSMASGHRTAPRQIVSATQEVLPSITRKVKACAACRKQKIKCNMENDEPPCVRCVQRGLSCVLNKSLQSLLDDSRQVQDCSSDIVNLHHTLTAVCQHLDLRPPLPLQTQRNSPAKVNTETSYQNVEDQEQDDDDGREASPPMSPSDRQAPIDTFLEATAKVDSPVSAPVESPHGSTISRRSAPEPDIISKGLISMAVAESLTSRYLQRLDHFLYGIGSAFTDLKGLRRASPILLAAVCTISALHDHQDQKTYDICNKEFLQLVSKSLFEKRGVEFLRALCLGSFWLSDASRILNSDALRRSADVRLPKYFYQVTVPDSTVAQSGGNLSLTAKADRVRIWYLLYICDQHLSILYNRDPIIHGDQDIILGWEAFLESTQTSDSNIRIASQVSLLQTMSQMRTAFGSESAEPLPKALATSFNNYNRQVDQWFTRFSPAFKPNPHIGDFPHKGLTLHYHFAKLYLGHHVFRGLNSDPIPAYFLPAALMAHGAAISIFEFILNDVGLKSSLIGVPFYFHVMISFAGNFLLSCSQYSEQLSLEVESNIGLIDKAITLFRSMACVPQHPLSKMTAALERRMFDYKNIVNKQKSINTLAVGVSHAGEGQWAGTVGSGGTIEHGGSHPIYGNDAVTFSEPHSMMATNSTLGHRTGYGSTSSGVPDGYAMMGPADDTTFDFSFQDFGGFDFPAMHMNFPS